MPDIRNPPEKFPSGSDPAVTSESPQLDSEFESLGLRRMPLPAWRFPSMVGRRAPQIGTGLCLECSGDPALVPSRGAPRCARAGRRSGKVTGGVGPRQLERNLGAVFEPVANSLIGRHGWDQERRRGPRKVTEVELRDQPSGGGL
jgi:hypothetical protein